MTTQSCMQAPTLVLLFSERASKSYKTYNVRMENGDVYQFNMASEPRPEKQGPDIMPYFHDAVTVATINTADIQRTRGPNEMPPLGQLVKLEEELTQRYHGTPAVVLPVAKPIIRNHF